MFFLNKSIISPSKLASKTHNRQIDCIKIHEERVFSKSIDGNVYQWNFTTGDVICKIKVPHANNLSCTFDMDKSATILVVGDSENTLHFYTITEKSMSEFYKFQPPQKKLISAINCVAFSHNLRNVIFGSSSGVLWRLDKKESKPETVISKQNGIQNPEKEEDGYSSDQI